MHVLINTFSPSKPKETRRSYFRSTHRVLSDLTPTHSKPTAPAFRLAVVWGTSTALCKNETAGQNETFPSNHDWGNEHQRHSPYRGLGAEGGVSHTLRRSGGSSDVAPFTSTLALDTTAMALRCDISHHCFNYAQRISKRLIRLIDKSRDRLPGKSIDKGNNNSSHLAKMCQRINKWIPLVASALKCEWDQTPTYARVSHTRQ